MSTFTNTAREVEMPNGDVVVIHNAPTGGENTTSNIKKFKYDDNGHVTESTVADAEDLNLSGYSTPTTGSTDIGTSDDVQTAIGKLDHQSHIDQTNILYTLQTGANNLAPKSYLTITGNAKTESLAINLPAGNYYLSVNATLANGCDAVFKNSAGTNVCTITGIANGSNAKPFTLTDTATEFYFYTVDANATFDQIMICDKVIWDTLGHNYQPPALPNYDLTRLEAEDRAALAEEIDAGAKNKFNLAGAIITTGNASYTISGNSITVTSSGTWAVAYTPITLPAGDYVLDLDVTTRTSTTTNPKITIYTSVQLMDYAGSLDIKATGHYTLSFRSTGSTLYLAWYANQSGTSSSTNTLTVTNMLVATKAAFCTSPKFVPYRYDPYTTVWQNVANATLYARRNGRTVTINGYVDNVSFTAGSNTSLGTINNEIGKPLQQVRAVCSIGANAYSIGEPSYLTIATDGNVVVNPKTYTGTGAVFFSVSYTI